MKLAEALVERKALKEKLERLRQRLAENARVQEGDAPSEEPNKLLAEARDVLAQFESLNIRINTTNIRALFVEGEPRNLMEAIAERDRLALERGILDKLVESAGVPKQQGFPYVVTRSEVKFRATVDVASLQKEIDALAKQYRELDARIQARNFETELIE